MRFPWGVMILVAAFFVPTLGSRFYRVRPRHGFAELLAMFDAGSSEVLPPGWPGPAAR